MSIEDSKQPEWQGVDVAGWYTQTVACLRLGSCGCLISFGEELVTCSCGRYSAKFVNGIPHLYDNQPEQASGVINLGSVVK